MFDVVPVEHGSFPGAQLHTACPRESCTMRPAGEGGGAVAAAGRASLFCSPGESLSFAFVDIICVLRFGSFFECRVAA
jgi:hypothetical protein